MIILLIIMAYLLGAIPFGVIFAKMKGVNLLECGSGNTGATNAFRCAGPLVGILTGVCDILKGFLAAWISYLILGPDEVFKLYLVCFAVIIGHTNSVFLRFKGGKAIATSFGVFLFINPIPILLTVLVWGITLLFSRIISLSSIVAGIALPIITLFYQPNWILEVLTLLIAVFVIWRHKDNIKRLRAGTEQKIGRKQTNRNLK